jgi:2-polyprenyl-3-methyl-5-hydroxy-6-metoxy-1,4-benzoquinol methylase
MSDTGLSNYGWNSIEATEAHSYIIPHILDLLPASNRLRILDAGCGNGYLAARLAELGHEVIGVDIAEDGIVLARAQLAHVRFVLRSVYDDLSDIAKDMDLVTSSEVIEHLYSPRRFLHNMYSLIRPGGHIILTTPYHGYLKNLLLSLFNLWDKHHTVDWEGGHIKFFSKKMLAQMLSDVGYCSISFNNAGRGRYLWKSMVCRAQKPDTK